MTAPDVPSREPALLHAVVQDRIAELWSWRSWYRNHRWLRLYLLETAHRTELRALLRLVREARRQAEVAAAQDAVWRTTMLSRPEPEWDVKAPRKLCLHGVRETEECPECGFGWEPEQADPVTRYKALVAAATESEVAYGR